MTLTARTKELLKTQRRNLVKTTEYPYTVLTMTADGEDVAGYWHIKTPADERMFIDYAAPDKVYRVRA